MQRREFLKATSGIATVGGIGLSGCVGAPESGAEETETDAGSPEDTEPAGGTESPDATGAGAETETGTPTESGAETATEAETPAETTTGGGQEVATHYRLGGRVEGWQGREPQRIADATNPTLRLEAGTTYEVTWENLDGVPHDFAVQDSQGNNITQTEIASEQGQTLTLTFTATEEMARYICTIHPSTMVGDIEFGSG